MITFQVDSGLFFSIEFNAILVGIDVNTIPATHMAIPNHYTGGVIGEIDLAVSRHAKIKLPALGFSHCVCAGWNAIGRSLIDFNAAIAIVVVRLMIVNATRRETD